MLSDVGIKALIKNGDIELVDPDGSNVFNIQTGEERDVGQLQAHGYDLRAHRVYSFAKGRWIELKDSGDYRLRPDEFAIIGTYERIRLSKSVGATLNSMARETLDGLSHDPTTIHPGLAANEPHPAYLVVAVKNISPMPLVLSYKEPFCRVIFEKMDQTPHLSAPSLDDVKRNFHKMELEAARYSGTSARRTGMVLFVVSIVISALALYLVAQNYPALSAATTALVVVLLTTALSWIRNRFKIL